MFFCYIDESGTPVAGKETSHYVLAGIAIPVKDWKLNEKKIAVIKRKYSLHQDTEIHTAWILRDYREQDRINNFEKLSPNARRYEVQKLRDEKVLKLKSSRASKKEKLKLKTVYSKTSPFIHLTRTERKKLVLDVAKEIGKWGNSRLFAECIDKNHFVTSINSRSIDGRLLSKLLLDLIHILIFIHRLLQR